MYVYMGIHAFPALPQRGLEYREVGFVRRVEDGGGLGLGWGRGE